MWTVEGKGLDSFCLVCSGNSTMSSIFYFLKQHKVLGKITHMTKTQIFTSDGCADTKIQASAYMLCCKELQF